MIFQHVISLATALNRKVFLTAADLGEILAARLKGINHRAAPPALCDRRRCPI
jgi:hypothetical protein